MIDRPVLPDIPLARLLLPVLVVIWLVPRFVGPAADPGAAAVRAVEAVSAGPSPESGRLEIRGLPGPDADPADLLSRPEILAARVRLQQRVATENDLLAIRAADIARRLEPTDDELVGLRLSGWLIPFYGRHADALRQLGDEGRARPWEALRGLSVTLESRLEEPPEGVDLEISGQRRDLTRLFRETDDALKTAEANVAEAVDVFRRDALTAAAASAGPFRRRGRGLVLEMLLASLLGATVRESVRRRATPGGTLLRLSFAPALALGVLLPLAGSSLLPMNSLSGLSMAFLPMAFALGFGAGGLLRIVSRLDRLYTDEDERDEADERFRAREGATDGPSSAGAVPRPAEDVVPAALPPLRERVRVLAREVMAATGEPAPPAEIRTEREIPEEPMPRRAFVDVAAPRAGEKLPFAKRRT